MANLAFDSPLPEDPSKEVRQDTDHLINLLAPHVQGGHEAQGIRLGRVDRGATLQCRCSRLAGDGPVHIHRLEQSTRHDLQSRAATLAAGAIAGEMSNL